MCRVQQEHSGEGILSEPSLHLIHFRSSMNSKEFIHDYFRERSIAFPAFYTSRPLLPIEQFIVDQIPAESNVLDLCCGGGEMSLAIAKRGATVTGVDYVGEMCYLCHTLFVEEGYAGTILKEDATDLSFPDNSFSHVVCAGSSLNSMPNEDARLTIREIARVVKPGGTVYLVILNPHGLRNLVAVARGLVQGAPRWGFYYRSGDGIDADGKEIPRGLSFLLSAGRLKQYMREAGLRYRISNWNIGFAASHWLVTAQKLEGQSDEGSRSRRSLREVWNRDLGQVQPDDNTCYLCGAEATITGDLCDECYWAIQRGELNSQGAGPEELADRDDE